MRRFGAELNVEAMALYRYVPGREQLLDEVVEYVMNELYDSTMTGELTGSWQEYLRRRRKVCEPWRLRTRESFRWWRPGRLLRRGSGHRCAASAGSKAFLMHLRDWLLGSAKCVGLSCFRHLLARSLTA